jgi:transposase
MIGQLCSEINGQSARRLGKRSKVLSVVTTGDNLQAVRRGSIFNVAKGLGMMGWTPPGGIDVPVCALEVTHTKEASMGEVSIIGLDLAKRVFQVHGADSLGERVFSRKLSRGQLMDFFRDHHRCVVAMEACSSAHYWGREIAALGHEVRLIPAQYVKPFVKRQKNDAADAEAICEAAVRPTMRFVQVRSAWQHAQAMVFRSRDMLVRQRTQLLNAIRGHCAEMGLTAPVGAKGYEALKALVAQASDLPPVAREVLDHLAASVEHLSEQVDALEKKMAQLAKQDGVSKALTGIPGVGPVTALAVQALGPDPRTFKSGRDYAAWMGLVPRQHSSGGKERLGKITRKGNRTLRRLLVICAGTVVTSVARSRTKPAAWLEALLKRRPRMVAITALANKIARMIWALQVKGGVYQAPSAT